MCGVTDTRKGMSHPPSNSSSRNHSSFGSRNPFRMHSRLQKLSELPTCGVPRQSTNSSLSPLSPPVELTSYVAVIWSAMCGRPPYPVGPICRPSVNSVGLAPPRFSITSPTLEEPSYPRKHTRLKRKMFGILVLYFDTRNEIIRRTAWSHIPTACTHSFSTVSSGLCQI